MITTLFVNITDDQGTLLERIQIDPDDYNFDSVIHRNSLADRLFNAVDGCRKRQTLVELQNAISKDSSS